MRLPSQTVPNDYFDRWGAEGDQTYEVLNDGCMFPPSLEVFEHGLEVSRAKSGLPISIVRYARAVVSAYTLP